MSVDDAKNIYKSTMSDPISHSINVIKIEFKKHGIENNARDLLFADTVVKESAWQACFIPRRAHRRQLNDEFLLITPAFMPENTNPLKILDFSPK